MVIRPIPVMESGRRASRPARTKPVLPGAVNRLRYAFNMKTSGGLMHQFTCIHRVCEWHSIECLAWRRMIGIRLVCVFLELSVTQVRQSRSSMIEATRAKLIAAARSAFAQHGYAQASMDELTAQAGLTRGALYHHFGGKPGLLAAVFAQIDAEM